LRHCVIVVYLRNMPKPGAPFTEREDEILKANYLEMDTAALAQTLGRTLSSTQSRLRHLGLRKRPTDRPTTDRMTVLFDTDLMPKIRAGADAAGLSMSGYVQELVKRGLQRKKKKAA